MQKTHEGGRAYEHSLDHHLEFFSKAGSAYTKSKQFYSGAESALSLFQKAWIVNKELALKLLFWCRDARGGAGNRSGSRDCYKWLAANDPAWLRVNMPWIPEVGRWDDLRSLFGTELEPEAAALWGALIKSKDVLAAKWADRKDRPIRDFLNISEADFRKLLSGIRKNHIVEHKMCTARWNEIDYHTIPSLAMARYTKAFDKHDADRFNKYKEGLEKGTETIHADVLFPHDCVRTCKHGDIKIADAQFNALPNYMEETNEKIIVLADTSGSMCAAVGGKVCAVDVSQGLALYCSGKIPKENPFHKKFIGFESESKFKDWNGLTFSKAVNDRRVFDGACGGTRIDKALDLILKTALFFNLKQDQLPTLLLIISDMQFHFGGVEGDGSEVEIALKRWVQNGYEIPRIIYWNVSTYAGSPATVKSKNVGLVSGFSPSILKAILSGEDFSPTAIMMRAIEKYKVNKP